MHTMIHLGKHLTFMTIFGRMSRVFLAAIMPECWYGVVYIRQDLIPANGF